jgi:TonB family protein
MNMSSSSQDTLFSLLPPTRTPWTEFLFSTGTQVFAVAFILWLRMLYPSIVTPMEHTFRSVQLVSTPVPVNHQPQPVRELPKPVYVATLEAPSDALRLPAPLAKPRMQTPQEEAAPAVTIEARKPDPLPPDAAPVIPKQGVKTNTFSAGSSAIPTIAKPAAQVQTGGFGDPNGIPAKPGQGKATNIAALGSFDLPSGPGSGNGTGGAKGVAGVVPSAGFGNSTAIQPQKTRVLAGAVQPGGFSSGEVAPPAARTQAVESVVRAVPAEILSKPVPVYTQEARNLRIEGEVLLEVVLRASGTLEVQRVVRGLGHGLDDNAVKAAEQIHFKPAMRNGQPADSTVVLHIIFQLA